jgi:capsular polysaccharide biosynthesis protein
LRHPKRYDESVAVIATRSCNNLYHWLVDALPRLRLVEASGLAVRRLYTPIWAAYHKQALDLLGIDERQCIPAKRYQNIVASEIILPSSPPGFPTQEVCEFLWTKLLPPALRMTAATNRRRLYISRRNARWRRIANEPDLVDLLGEHGFERIELENFPLVEQIRLMHEAEFVVGPHGAGLTHLAFCKPGTRVLEINTPCRPIHCFYHIAYWRGLRYLNLVGEQNGAAAHFGEDSNIIVDLGRAERALKLLDDIAPLNPTEHAS